MSTSGLIEYARRGLVLILLCLGLVGLALWGWTVCVLFFLSAAALYVWLPGVAAPADALIYERMPAIVGPDIIGLALTSIFFSLPFWARLGDDALWENFGIMVHPAAFLTWPLAAVSVLIIVTAARNASFWIVVETNGLRLSTARRMRTLSYNKIRRAEPYRRGLPKQLKWITPLLVLTGRYGAAGAILVARDITGMQLRMKDGSVEKISREAFESHFEAVLSALREHGVEIDPSLLTADRKQRV